MKTALQPHRETTNGEALQFLLSAIFATHAPIPNESAPAKHRITPAPIIATSSVNEYNVGITRTGSASRGRTLVLVIQRVDRPTYSSIFKGFEIARTGSRRVHGIVGASNGVIGLPMSHSRLNANQKCLLRLYALAAQLTQIERRSLPTGQENPDPLIANHCAGAHVDILAAGRNEMISGVFELKPVLTGGDQLCVQFDGRAVESGTLFPDG
jgi:hypothetical protein